MINNIIKGVLAYGRTFKLISRLGLWKYFGVPMLISLSIAIAIGLFAWGFSDNLGIVISRLWLWEWGAETFSRISNFFGGLIIIIIGLIVYKHIVLALSAPFMSPVSAKIESYLTGQPPNQRNTSNISQLWRGIRINTRNLIRELLISIPIILIGFIPVIGFISPILLFLIQAYYAGFGNMDYTLERYFGVKESTQFVTQNKGAAIGNGIPFILMLLIPIVGVIMVIPLSVTAASSETVRILRDSQWSEASQMIK